jgi:hypothetical protein
MRTRAPIFLLIGDDRYEIWGEYPGPALWFHKVGETTDPYLCRLMPDGWLCDCKGHQVRGYCRHTRAADQLYDLFNAQADNASGQAEGTTP